MMVCITGLSIYVLNSDFTSVFSYRTHYKFLLGDKPLNKYNFPNLFNIILREFRKYTNTRLIINIKIEDRL